MTFNWPVICDGDYRESKPPIVPETLGESASIHGTDIKGLCLTAVYVLLAQGKITIADVHGAYALAKGGASSSS